ncbi:MAG: bifunctional acyl-ACP--phospholipid O-acyltransferase/long-chain-fatty-acid--ACP ligase [Nitrospirae bacterium]|nr:MAG: bifunctional acyl-ACP--phospholipid O-acyltransferase/long-chain-fatty-acid--ACP ligase [Nitrospirota bacterium]
MLLYYKFIRSAKQQGSKPAFIDTSAGRTVSYSKALIATLILSKKFDRFDTGFIGIMLPTSAGCALSYLGALMSGRTPVMINYSTGIERNIRYAQKRCGFRTVITSRAFLEKINCPPLDDMVFIEDIMAGVTATDRLKAALLSKLPFTFIQKRIYRGHPDDTVVILFTSGSEKDPKAVQLTHRSIGSNIDSFCSMAQVTDRDIILANLPFFHVFGLTVNLLTPLLIGMTAISHANPLDYKMICSIVREHKPTIMVGTPSFLSGYVRKSEPGDFSSLRLVLCGADKCPDALRQEFLEKHGITLYEGYGATETSPVISVNLPEKNRPGSVGQVLPGVEVRIENYDTGNDCGVGEVGRILVKGDLLMKGYFGDFEETSMRIRHGWYDTGDMGFMDSNGFLWHSGRLKRFVKIGGEMVSLVSVENVLEKLLPEGASCCVVEVPDPVKGARIIAAVTQPLDEKLLHKKMAEQLPNIALPRQFVVMEELPKMGSGKIDFRTVTEMVRHVTAHSPAAQKER